MTPIIRLATAMDAAELPAIEVLAGDRFRAIDDLAWIADDDGMSLSAHLKAIDAGTEWVAEDGSGKPVGFLSAERHPDALHIWEVSVLPDYQGHGIGKALMQYAEDFAREEELTALTLTTFRDVPWNEGFYKYLGYLTLADDVVPIELRAILEHEKADGLPIERRCAMRKALS